MFRSIKQNYYDFLFAVLVVLLPFSKAIPSILLGVLLFFFIIDFKNIDFKRLTEKSLIILFVFISYIIIKALFLKVLIQDVSMYSRYLFIVIIPILFLKIKNRNLLKNAVILSVLGIIIKSVYLIVDFYNIYKTIPLGNSRIVNSLLTMERPYAGFMCVVAIILCGEQIIINKKYKWVYIIISIVSILFVLFITARNAILTLFFLCILYFFFYFKTHLVKKILLFLAMFILLVSMLFMNKNFFTRFYLQSNLQNTINEVELLEPRYIIWPCAFKITNENDFSYLFGFKNETLVRQKLTDCYSASIVDNEYKKNWFETEKFNTHNQFLGFYLSQGLIGLTMLLGMFYCFVKTKRINFYAVASILTVFSFFIFENVLYRQFGCYIFGILIALYSFDNKEIKQNDSFS